jgi:hypothetical protein
LDLEKQRENIKGAIDNFVRMSEQKILVFPPGDKIERYIVHSCADEGGCVTASFGEEHVNK